MIRTLTAVGLALGLAACVAAPQPAPPPTVTPPMPRLGLDQVLGRTAPQLVQLFGEPSLDLREPRVRRLQFAGPACVLDVYLYPPARGGGEAAATHVDARLPNGDDFDRASCVAALRRAR